MSLTGSPGFNGARKRLLSGAYGAPARSREAGLQKRDERVAGNPGFKGEQRDVSEMQNNAISQGEKYESPCPENKEKHL